MTGLAEDAISRRTRGLDRAFEILDFLRQHREPIRPNEIATQIGAPRSSIYELVNLLIRNGILEYRGDDGRVFLGRKLYFLGVAYAEEFDLIRECTELLATIAQDTRETAQLCMLEGNKYTVGLMKEGARPFRISSDVGKRVPIPWTASGRLLVDHLSDAEILSLIPEEDFKLPDGSWLSAGEFIDQVREAGRAGHFVFHSIVDTFTICFAVPVLDKSMKCVATLCLVAPKEDGQNNLERYLEILKTASEKLSGKFN